MRFAIACVDRYIGVFDAFLRAGWSPVKLFTVPLDNRTEFNHAVVAKARELKIPVQLSRMDTSDLEDLARRGCDTLVVASYDWRIPDWTPHLAQAVNFHPSPLPEGRGPYPAVRAILDGFERWAVSCHRIEHAFDTGAVLARDSFALANDECHESLNLKIQMSMHRLAVHVARDFTALWREAAAQSGGSYFARWSDADRTLDFAEPVDSILRRVRAFGLLETLAPVMGQTLHVRRATGWREAHTVPPGTVAHVSNRHILVAAGDGFIALLEWSMVGPQEFAHLGRLA